MARLSMVSFFMQRYNVRELFPDRYGQKGGKVISKIENDQITISVLMPMFNCAQTLESSVASVMSQTRTDWELILVDDASTDSSREIAQKFAQGDPRISVLTLAKNSGAAAARNHALGVATGRYIAFLDADDQWHHDKLRQQIKFMENTNAALCFTAYARVSTGGDHIETVRVPQKADYYTLLKRNILGALTVIYDTQQVGKPEMPILDRQHDYALWLHLVRQFGPALGLDEILATYRVSTASLSSNKALAARDIWRVYRECEGLPLYRSLWAFAHYTYYGLRYRAIQRPIKR